MSSYTSSPTFDNAASYLSTAASLSSVSNAIKLELYGLYKYLTVSHTPNTSKPSIFDMTGRAKWDAWNATSKTYGDRANEAEARYIALARELGWSEDKAPTPVGELDLDADDGEAAGSSQGGGEYGFAMSVSTMSTSDERSGSALNDLAIAGNTPALRAFLDANPGVDVNAKDENGYTPLHLACDRGRAEVVRLLLERGANPSIKDDDDLTAKELAEVSGHDEIIGVLKAV